MPPALPVDHSVLKGVRGTAGGELGDRSFAASPLPLGTHVSSGPFTDNNTTIGIANRP